MIPLRVTRLRKNSLILGLLVVLACVLAGARANAQGDDLINAAMKGDVPRVKALLAAGADVNSKLENGGTALMMASALRHLDVVRVLLHANADVNAKTTGTIGNGTTALMFASQAGPDIDGSTQYVDIVRALLDAKVDVNAKRGDGETALSLASEKGYQDVVRLLKNAGGSSAGEAYAPGDDLINAADQGDLPRVKALLDGNVDVNARNSAGSTALMRASAHGHLEVAQALLAKGADVNLARKTNPAMNILDRYCSQPTDETALIEASEGGYQEIVRALLAAKADVNAKDCGDRTALLFASSWNRAGVVRLLLNAGADVNAVDRSGKTALGAANAGHAHSVKKLLRDAGAH